MVAQRSRYGADEQQNERRGGEPRSVDAVPQSCPFGDGVPVDVEFHSAAPTRSRALLPRRPARQAGIASEDRLTALPPFSSPTRGQRCKPLAASYSSIFQVVCRHLWRLRSPDHARASGHCPLDRGGSHAASVIVSVCAGCRGQGARLLSHLVSSAGPVPG